METGVMYFLLLIGAGLLVGSVVKKEKISKGTYVSCLVISQIILYISFYLFLTNDMMRSVM